MDSTSNSRLRKLLCGIAALLAEAKSNVRTGATRPNLHLCCPKLTRAQVGRVAPNRADTFSNLDGSPLLRRVLPYGGQYPNAVFILFRTATVTEEAGEEFRLGTFEL
jgi:hypothetical protein